MQAISIAAAGMMAAADRLTASAHRMAAADAQAERAEGSATGGAADVDYVSERVGQISAANDFKANAVVIKTANEMAGALLNLKV
jgi:flagellar hook protein FlgE